VRVFVLGAALDALTLWGEVLTVAVFRADTYDRLFANLVETDDRAVALCSTRLATLHLTAGNLAEGERAARLALAVTPGLRSARINQDLAMVRSAAARHAGTTAELTDSIGDDLDATT
jgi:hypothetical protein